MKNNYPKEVIKKLKETIKKLKDERKKLLKRIKILEKNNNSLVLSKKDFKKVEKDLKNPPKCSKRLRQAFKEDKSTWETIPEDEMNKWKTEFYKIFKEGLTKNE